MATPNSLGKEGRRVVLLFSQEAPWHCGQKTRNTFTGKKNNGDKLLCTLLAVLCGAKVTDVTAAYALRTPSQTGDIRLAKTATWWHVDCLQHFTWTLCTSINLCEYSYNNMVQSRIRWTMTPTMTAWMTVPHCCIAVTLVFVVSSSQQQQQHTVSQSGSDCSSRQASHTHTHSHSQF